MSKYIGSSAVNLSTTSADVTGNADIDGNLTVGGNLTVSGTTITVDHATAQTVDLGDNDKIRLGADYELQLWSDGTTGQISGDINHTGSITTDGLSVSGSSTSIFNSGAENVVATFTSTDTEAQINLVDTTGSAQIRSRNDLRFYTNGGSTRAMDIDASGSVGIGTSLPIRPLSVKASQEQLTLSEGDARGATFDYRSSTGNLNIATNGVNARTSPQLTLDLNGRLGIGSSPSAALDVRRVDADGKIAEFHQSTGFGFTLSSSQAVASIESGYLQDFVFKTGSTATERMRIDSSGNVNIGISSGAGTLTIASSGNTGLILRQNTASDRFKFFVGDGTGGYAVDENFISSSNTNLRFLAGGSGTSEVMQLTSSGNLLVGMTSASTNNDGAGIRADGLIHAKRADVVATFNRKTTNGTVVQIAKDNTVVGSIKSRNSESLMIGSDYGSDAYICLSNDNVFPVTSTGFVKDGATNLGVSTGRFKDLYLSGGVYLGGTGSANKLDDYESGTWTPQIYYQNITNNGNAVESTQTGKYVKIGQLVYVEFRLIWSVTGSLATDNVYIDNLPFVGEAPNTFSINGIMRAVNTSNNTLYYFNRASDGSSRAVITDADGTGNQGAIIGANSTNEMRGSATYFTTT